MSARDAEDAGLGTGSICRLRVLSVVLVRPAYELKYGFLFLANVQDLFVDYFQDLE